MAQGTNSSAPTTARIAGGTYNATPPVLVDGQAASFQFDPNANLKTLSELSDGTNVLGVTGNPVKVAAVASGGIKAIITASISGATTIVAAVGGKKIRVVSMQLTVNAAVNVKWQSHVTPTDLSGLAYFAANGGYVLPYNPEGWFLDTTIGEALDINLSAAVAIGGSLTYVTV